MMWSSPYRAAQRSTKLSQKLVVLQESIPELPPSALNSPVAEDLLGTSNVPEGMVSEMVITSRQMSSPMTHLRESDLLELSTNQLPRYKEAFYMNFGAVVLWGYEEEEERDILRALGPFELDKITMDDIETDYLQCCYDETKTPRIYQDIIFLTSQENYLQKVAISMALGQSVKLGYFEYNIDDTMENLKDIPKEIVAGEAKMSQKDCIKIIGQLYILKKHVILSTSILDSPEMFWFERQVSPLYDATRLYMEITQRVKILNQKVLVISDMLAMLNESVTNQQEESLEWIVIILVFISTLMAAFKIYMHVEHFLSTKLSLK